MPLLACAVDRDGDPGRWQLGRVALYDARSYAGDADHEPDLNGVMILFLAVGSRYGVEGIAASYAIKTVIFLVPMYYVSTA